MKHSRLLIKNNYHVKKSDRTHHIYGLISIGDTIKWCGNYFDGYNEDRSFKNVFLSGVNKVKSIYSDGYLVCMELDNNKIFFIKNLRDNRNEVPDGWEKIN